MKKMKRRFQSSKRIGETTLCPIFNLIVESSEPRSKLMGSLKFYFKASIMKQCFEEHLTSTDRLRKYVISPSGNVQNVDNSVLLGVTVIVKINGDFRKAVMK